MKYTAVLILAALLSSSCESVPVTVSWSGTSDGHTYTAGYSTGSGTTLAVHQK